MASDLLKPVNPSIHIMTNAEDAFVSHSPITSRVIRWVLVISNLRELKVVLDNKVDKMLLEQACIFPYVVNNAANNKLSVY